MIHLHIVICSTRKARSGPSIARWITSLAEADGRFAVELVDLAEIDLPLFDEPHHPRLGTYEHEHTKRWSAIVSRADAFVFVTPEYNHAAPASIKNAIDYLNAEWRHKPVGFVCYGGVSAGTRAVASLKPVVSNLKMLPVAETVAIPFFDKLIDADGTFRASAGLEASTKPMFDGIAFYADTIGPQGLRD